jgi:hypothetical protein
MATPRLVGLKLNFLMVTRAVSLPGLSRREPWWKDADVLICAVPRAFTTELTASARNSVRVLRLADPALALAVCTYIGSAFSPPAARALAGYMVTQCNQASWPSQPR